MKVPLSWLKDYVDVTVPVAALAEKLTLAGHEVAAIETTGGGWDKIVIGQITAVEPHPNADRLHLATVDLGAGRETVVCGALNLNVGDKIAFARAGARLTNPFNGQVEELKPAKIRGVLSAGMVCSEKELGISESHEGILVLPSEAQVGTPLADFLGDTVFDVEVTANRPDCLSVVGIAREVGALTGQKMHVPEIKYEEKGRPIAEQINIEIADPDLCPRYCATLITGVTIAESPPWLQARLVAGGQRPINNVVDITNYVMLEYGQPLHSFDYDKIRGRRIVPSRAADGEVFYTLDGAERKLSGDMLVIGDGGGTVAIAGVMGGLDSEVTEGTTAILLEAASFKAASIHYTSRKLGLISEASTRFGRGISAGLTIPALRHATRLIAELGGGTVSKGLIDVYPGKKTPAPVPLTTQEIRRVVGVDYSLEQIAATLASLGFECRTDGSRVEAVPPYWRSDIRQDVDLIEEVARIAGYDKIRGTLLGEAIPPQDRSPLLALKQKLRQGLVGCGFQEVITFSLTSLQQLNMLTPDPGTPQPVPLRVVNPMSADQEYLRPNLRANLLATLASNRRHEDGGIRLFELGRVYRPRPDDLPAEPEVLCGILSGPRTERSWLGGDGLFDFYDVKGAIEALMEHIGVSLGFENSHDAGLHPTRQAAVVIEGDGKKTTVGVIGELHPKVADGFEIAGTIGLFEIDVNALLPFTILRRMYRPVWRFPGTIRDLALVVDAGVTHRQVMDIFRGFALISEVELFDVYSGKQVAAGQKSMAYRLVYQSPTHTLTDEEVSRVQEQVLRRLTGELGAALRG
jgi:phenylalanyl-tRNA synthetase beta chain